MPFRTRKGIFFIFNVLKKVLLFFFFFLGLFTTKAQFLNDGASKLLVEKALKKMYNQEIDPAENLLKPIFTKYADHPVSFLLKALLLQQRNVPIENNSLALQTYKNYLQKTILLSNTLIKEPKYKAEATFYLLAAHGLIAEIYHNKKEYLSAGNEGRKAYQYLKDGYELKELNPDFYFTSGLYDFYRERYPLNHPEIKPVIVFFKKGNEANGINFLKTATKKALFTNVEANTFLIGILVKYKNKLQEAMPYSEQLVKEFPKNQEFRMRYIEILISLKKYSLAQDNLSNFQSKGLVYETAQNLFLGSLEELDKKNDERALGHYAKCIKSSDKGRYIKDYKTMAYLGMARIFERQKNTEKARIFAKECIKNAEYTNVKKEAEELLKRL